jgi:hypothetical protein
VVQEKLWILTIESKPARLDVTVGIPQALTYLLSAPTSQSDLFGLVSNGREAIFLKLDQTSNQYARSMTYRLLENEQERVQLLQGLKAIGSLIQAD